LGEAADALLDLQRVVPRRALEAGYGFTFPEIDGALGDLVRR
jgi:NAD dependent epimerase/dehydratase family enzyme